MRSCQTNPSQACRDLSGPDQLQPDLPQPDLPPARSPPFPVQKPAAAPSHISPGMIAPQANTITTSITMAFTLT